MRRILAIAVLAAASAVLIINPADAGKQEHKQACLEKCRAVMRAKPGFVQNRSNIYYCKDKCGIPH